jgi:hypothetical protein
MNNLTKKVEMLANISIIVVASLLVIVLVKVYLRKPVLTPDIPTAQQTAVGTKLSLPGVDWGQAGQTIVLAISNTCHFCSESAGFYQRLALEKAKHDGLRMIAVLPQEESEGRAYLSGLGVNVDDVKQMPLDAIGVTGTPTLFLVDRAGVVKTSWIGKLTKEKEEEVVKSF